MKSDRPIYMLSLALGFILLAGCHEDSIHPPKGFISVSVVDATEPPPADVEICIVPLGLSARTDARGHVLFEVPAGDYFVDADLCCRGPGFIEHHVPVTVSAGEFERIELQSCLTCQ